MVNVVRLLDTIGIRDKIARVYWRTKILLGLEFSHTVGGITTKFQPEDFAECRRLVNLTEPEILEEFLNDVRPSDIVFDIGANVGEYSVFASRIATNGFVAAFDPIPVNVNRCETYLTQNAKSDWKVYPTAISDEDGVAYLDRQVTSAGVGNHFISPSGDGDKIDMHRIDTLVTKESVPIPDIVKIDVEGAEGRVLRGFGDLLEEVRVIYCELHPERLEQFGDTKEGITETLDNSGFDYEILGERGDQYHIRATHRSRQTNC